MGQVWGEFICECTTLPCTAVLLGPVAIGREPRNGEGQYMARGILGGYEVNSQAYVPLKNPDAGLIRQGKKPAWT